ncbi:MAG TPA: glycosyltransferase family 2 protein [Candidatus Paceibacterota bacterium]|nr:glycosyltransferase family 2 protein [Candidatus Paceibacterota bacterium]
MLTLVTVNFNNAEATLGLLRSLERQSDRDFDVIVVDNASAPGDRALVGEFISSTTISADLVLNERNLGFSGGNNLAIRKALAQSAEWIVLINNDTTVSGDFIRNLKAALPKEPAVVGIPLSEEGSDRGEGRRIAYAGLVKWLKPTLPHIYEIEKLGAEHSQLLYAVGAGMAVHRDAFAKAGLLDERYFLYFEDADFSLRARRAGVSVRFISAPSITHGVSVSTRKLGAPLLLRYHARNALLFNKTHGPWWVRKSLPFAAFYGIVRQSVKLLLMPARRPESRAIMAGIVDFYAKRFGYIPPEAPDIHRH